MKIVNHRLCRDDGTPYPFKQSPNHGAQFKPGNLQYLVMHFTASRNAQEAISWLVNPEAKASAHLVIARDGSITQLVAFDTIAWHAGESEWEGKKWQNHYSIGIELDNAGPLTRKGSDWVHWQGGKTYPQGEVLVANHKHDKAGAAAGGWHTYPQAQLEAALEVSRLLVRQYGLKQLVGHEDIAPGRKRDPGPAFPMEQFRASVFAQQPQTQPTAQPAAGGEAYSCTTALNIRGGPGTQHAPLGCSPLAQGTRLHVLRREGGWAEVTLTDAAGRPVQGWVSFQYLAPLQAPPAR